jgi:flagellar motor component MotA
MFHSLAAALVSPIWGLFLIAAVFEPAVVILKKRQSRERQPEQ